jgi:hypothetical protein
MVVTVAYTSAWVSLSDALRIVMTRGASEQQAKSDICNAIADRAIDVRVDGLIASGDNVGVPQRLKPDDFDWTNSRPFEHWRRGPISTGRKPIVFRCSPVSLFEISRADVQNVLCHPPGTAPQVVMTAPSNNSAGAKAPSALPPRRRAKPVQYQIRKAVEALAKQHGGKFPPDDMPVFERDRLIVEWLDGNDDPVKPSKRTLRDYFKKQCS